MFKAEIWLVSLYVCLTLCSSIFKPFLNLLTTLWLTPISHLVSAPLCDSKKNWCRCSMKCQSASNVNKGGVMTLLNINNNRKLLVAMKCQSLEQVNVCRSYLKKRFTEFQFHSTQKIDTVCQTEPPGSVLWPNPGPAVPRCTPHPGLCHLSSHFLLLCLHFT